MKFLRIAFAVFISYWLMLLWLVGGVALTTVLTGCASTADIAAKGASVMDKGVESAEWVLCYGASIGSIKRAYAGNAKRLAAYNDLCAESSEPVLRVAE